MAESPILAFYGDDFTGSTDALESAARSGARSALFVDVPSPETLTRYPGIKIVGVGGRSRSLAPAEMEAELRPAFTALRALGVRHLHYKVCSTFDSSPAIGSIGRAIDVGDAVCGPGPVPLLVGAPQLGRYSVFGNLFARMGAGSNGAIYRLDRHPSMSQHPVTPADESDLRLHLARQTAKRIGLFDVLQVALPDEARRAAFSRLVAVGWDILLIDALYPHQLPIIGELLDSLAQPGRTIFSAGSSSIEAALGGFWASQGRLQPALRWPDPGPAEPLLAASGSCSPVTERQIARALAHGFAEVPVEAEGLADESSAGRAVEAAASGAIAHLRSGRSVIVHTCRGASDPRLAAGAQAFRRNQGMIHAPDSSSGGANPPAPSSPSAATRHVQTDTARILGGALGRIVRLAAAQTGVRRIVIAGGDTSSYAARAMGIEALEMISPIFPGAPLCRASAPSSPIDGLEVNFKGGQVGTVDYFLHLARPKLL